MFPDLNEYNKYRARKIQGNKQRANSRYKEEAESKISSNQPLTPLSKDDYGSTIVTRSKSNSLKSVLSVSTRNQQGKPRQSRQSSNLSSVSMTELLPSISHQGTNNSNL